MKLSKNIARILAVLLMIAMLAGYAPAGADKAASDPDSGAVVLADDEGGAVPEDNPTDGEPAQEGEGNTTDPTENTPPSGEGGDEPAPSGEGGEPQVVKVKVKFDDAIVTVSAGETELADGDEVDPETTLTIKPVEDLEAKALAVTAGEEELTADESGVYTFVTKTEDVTVNAFGVKDVTVSDADAWKTSKTITASVFGDIKTVELFDGEESVGSGSVSGGKATVKVTEDIGSTEKQFTVKLGDGFAKVETEAAVKMVDTKAPVAEFVDSERIGKYSGKYRFTYKLTETGSGFDKNSFSVTAYWNGSEARDQDFIDVKVDTAKGIISFVHTGAAWGKEYTYVLTGKDKAGNALVMGGADPFVIDEDAPKITGLQVQREYLSGKADPADVADPLYFGPGNTLIVSAEDEGFGIDWIDINNGSESVGHYKTSDLYNYNVSHEFKDVFKESGTYTVAVSDYGSTTTKSVNVIYDDTAPTLESAEVEVLNQSVFSKIVHALTGGLLFHEKVQINLAGDDDASGIHAIYYRVTEGSDAPGKWTLAEDVAEDFSSFTIDLAEYEGKLTVEVKLEDNVGNIMDDDSAVKVKFKVSHDDGSEELIEDAPLTQDATTRDQQKEDINKSKLVVFTYSSDQPYTAQVEGEDNWVKEVEFDVRYNAPSLNTSMPADEDTTTGSTYYTVGDPQLIVEFDNDESVPYKAEYEGNGKWIVKIGTDDTAYSGNVYFSVEQEIKKYTASVTEAVADDPNTTDKDEYQPRSVDWLPKEGEDVSAKYAPNNPVSVLVHVQNYLDSVKLTVDNKVQESGAVTGWFNSNGDANTLDNLSITMPKSVAPFNLTYHLTYTSNDGTITDAEVATAEEQEGQSEGVIQLLSNLVQYQKDGIYTLTASAKDVVGNEGDAQTVTIKYDVTAPLIRADFQDASTDINGSKYYKVNRTVTIYVSDATFLGEDSSEAAKYVEYAIKHGDFGADAVVLEGWKYLATGSAADEVNVKEGEGSLYAGGRWYITYGYGESAAGLHDRDGDDYTLTVSAKDIAGNESATDTDGKYSANKVKDENSKAYTGKDHADDFTVDQTPPVVSVRFDNSNARNGKYFNATRTAYITLVDHNFDPHDENATKLTANGSTGHSNWAQDPNNPDVWTMTVSYTADAQGCNLALEVMDMAGNVCPDSAVNYDATCVAVKDFVIDMTRPNVTYTGVDQSPYSGPCTPGFTSTDANLGNEFTFTVTRTNFKDGRKEITLPGSGTAASYSLANIPEDDRNNDGIYTVTVTVTDLAGNVTTLEPVEFAVNRFGSVYTLSKDLQNAVGKYFNKDGWAKTSQGKLAINEFNPTELKDDAKMEIYRDGVLVKSYTGAELKKLVSGGDRGSVGLYEYVYSLPTDVFSEDGVYRVVISSTDGADHKSANDKYGAEVSFVIDTVAPEIVSITGLEKHTVNAKEQEVAYQILDTYGLDRVTIRVNGPESSIYKEYISQAVLDSQNGKMESYQEMLPEGELDLSKAIKLPESSTPYHVVIEVTDKAGNKSVADGGTITRSTDEGAYTPSFDFLDSVTVSTNFFVRYIHNTGALIGTGVGVAAVAAGIWFVLAKRRKKDEEAA